MTDHTRIDDKKTQPIGGDMARTLKEGEMKPSKRLIAKPIERAPGEWVGQWSIPGMIPDFVRFMDTGKVKVYKSEIAATFAAMATAINVFNTPREKMQKARGPVRTEGGRPEKMSGRELSAAMGRHGITPGDLAYILDKPINRIMKWMDAPLNDSDTPHEVRVLMAIFDKYDDAIDIAEVVTLEALQEREDVG